MAARAALKARGIGNSNHRATLKFSADLGSTLRANYSGTCPALLVVDRALRDEDTSYHYLPARNTAKRMRA